MRTDPVVIVGPLVCPRSRHRALHGHGDAERMRNSVILVDQIRTEMESGPDPWNAVLDAAVPRTRTGEPAPAS